MGNLTKHTIDGSNERIILQELDIARYMNAKG